MVSTRSGKNNSSSITSSSQRNSHKPKTIILTVDTHSKKSNSRHNIRHKLAKSSSSPPPPPPSDSSPEEEEGGDNDNDNDDHSVVSSTFPLSSSSSTEESENTEEEDMMDNNEYPLPSSIRKNESLHHLACEVISRIEKEQPTLESILTVPMRDKHRQKLFDYFYMYQETEPNSEERYEYKILLQRWLKEYSQEYEMYQQVADSIQDFESTYESRHLFSKIPCDIVQLETGMENKEAIYHKYCELKEKEIQDDEYFKLKQWIRWALRLPFDRIKQVPFSKEVSQVTTFLQKVHFQLNQELYGMKHVKEQILLFLHHKILYPDMKGCCLGLIGDCGVGKTTIARSLAKVLDFPFEQISFGGVHNAEFLKGFDYTYVGSQPGEIVKCLTRMKYKNGILFFDEYEKVSSHSEIASFLLHITDFSQNSTYRDAYLSDITIDLSQLWFIYSMNELPEDRALADRIFAIHVPPYTTKEKVAILREFIVPKLLRQQTRCEKSILLSESVAQYIVDKVQQLPQPSSSSENSSSSSQKGGVRRLEQAMRSILFKLDFLICHQSHLNMSFSHASSSFSSYPVDITKDMVDILMKDLEQDSEKGFAFSSFYL